MRDSSPLELNVSQRDAPLIVSTLNRRSRRELLKEAVSKGDSKMNMLGTPDQFVGRLAIRTAPIGGPNSSNFSYSNIDPVTGRPGRYVKRCLFIERIEGMKIIAKRVSLRSGERYEVILEGPEVFDRVWAAVGNDGEVLVG